MKGGMLAALLAAPIVGTGSALLDGPLIDISYIIFPAFVTVMAISILLIGTFRSWDVRFLSGYIEGVLVFLVLTRISEAIIASMHSKSEATSLGSISASSILSPINHANGYFFHDCAIIDINCISRVAIGSLFYAVIVGTLLAAQVGFDAFMAHPRLVPSCIN
jgi:hypothetical protein